MSQIKDKLIAIYDIKAERNLNGDEVKVKKYIHDKSKLHAYVRELSEREKFSAKAVGAEQSTVFRVNYNSKIKAGQFLEFRDDTFLIQSIDSYEFYKRDLLIRAIRCKAEGTDYEEHYEP
ncbi:MAG: phage head closure protein [Christensenellales bacterium]